MALLLATIMGYATRTFCMLLEGSKLNPSYTSSYRKTIHVLPKLSQNPDEIREDGAPNSPSDVPLILLFEGS